MKMRSVRYLAGNGLKNIWLNRLMSIASIGVLVACMSMIGVAVMISKNVNKALSEIEKENVVMVYFNDKNSVLYGDASTGNIGDSGSSTGASAASSAASSAATSSAAASSKSDGKDEIPDSAYLIHNADEAKALCKKIEKIANVQSVEYIPKEQALETLKSNLLDNQEKYFEFIDDENPLSDGAKVVISDLKLFDETIKKIETTAGVDSVQSQENVADTVYALKRALHIAGFWIIGILMIISLVIVSNTIRVTMYNRKLEISIMKAVGATDSFIRLPFLVEGVAIGVISAVLSMGLVFFLYRAVVQTLKSVLSISAAVPFREFAWILLLLFLGVGIFAGIFGSVFVMAKYLKKEGSEFSAI